MERRDDRPMMTESSAAREKISRMCSRGTRTSLQAALSTSSASLSTSGQILALDAAAAEEEKVRMSGPVQALLKTAVTPLGRELRSSIDFFERQHDCHLTHVYACGGSACSRQLLDFLGEAVGIRIETWNPLEVLGTEHLNGERDKLEALGPALTAAFGAAVARL
ncbi:hypothetical protein HQ590_09715 [bacterium]|nr:hypothetical protein [bacterium]